MWKNGQELALCKFFSVSFNVISLKQMCFTCRCTKFEGILASFAENDKYNLILRNITSRKISLVSQQRNQEEESLIYAVGT